MPAGIHANDELVFPVRRVESCRLISANEERKNPAAWNGQRIGYWHGTWLFTFPESRTMARERLKISEVVLRITGRTRCLILKSMDKFFKPVDKVIIVSFFYYFFVYNISFVASCISSSSFESNDIVKFEKRDELFFVFNYFTSFFYFTQLFYALIVQ